MESARVASVFVTICLLVTTPVDSQTQKQSCDTGWFGSKCQFKCHCRDNRCDEDGECVGISQCERGWFGPACQYVDLMVTHSKLPTPWWLRDSDPTICNPGTGISPQTVNVTLEGAQHITWLRLHLNNTGLDQEFVLNFGTSSSDVRVLCPHRITTKSFVGSKISEIVDIFCDHNEPVEKLILSGKAISFLCSLFISGGRNVALREKTVQTSTRIESIDQTVQGSKGAASTFSYSSSLAVDGNTSGNWDHKSCTHTIGDKTDLNPNWDVIFSEPKIISRYVIYNRVSACCSDRLQGFILSVYDKEDRQLFQYQDKNLTGTLRVYSVLPKVPTTPVTRVNIEATLTDYRWPTPTLTLCEVELFGDSVCPLGKYGRDCERTCDCEGEDKACFVNTGECVSICATGRELDGCSLDLDQTTPQLSKEAVIGIVAGATVTVLVFIVVVTVYCYRLRKSRLKSRPGYDDLHFDRQELEHNYNTIGDADLLRQDDGYILPADVRYSKNPPLPPRSREQNTANNDSGETDSAGAYITVLEDPRNGHSAGVYDQPTNSARDKGNANAPSDSSQDRADDYAYAEWEEYVELEDVLSDAETHENMEVGQLEKL